MFKIVVDPLVGPYYHSHFHSSGSLNYYRAFPASSRSPHSSKSPHSPPTSATTSPALPQVVPLNPHLFSLYSASICLFTGQMHSPRKKELYALWKVTYTTSYVRASKKAEVCLLYLGLHNSPAHLACCPFLSGGRGGSLRLKSSPCTLLATLAAAFLDLPSAPTSASSKVLRGRSASKNCL